MFAIIDDDLVVGIARGDGAGVPIPPAMQQLPLRRMRLVGSDLVDAATVTSWHIDAVGHKRIHGAPDRQPLICAWDAILVREAGGGWRAKYLVDDLAVYAATKRRAVVSGGCVVTVAGVGVPCWADGDTQAALTALVVAAQLDPAQTATWKGRDGLFYGLDGADIAVLAMGVMAFVQTAFAAEAQLLAAIDAGTATTTAEIDAWTWPDSDAPMPPPSPPSP